MNSFFLDFSSSLLRDTVTSGVSSKNPWITGGSIGSKNAVLVFKTSALLQHSQSNDTHIPKALLSNKTPLSVAKKAYDGLASLKKKSLSTSFEMSKSAPGSLSSSENSISSACDDPADLEADIANAEKTNTNVFTATQQKEHDENEAPEDEEDAAVTEMPAAVLKITYKFTNTETKLLKKILSSHGLTEAEENQNFNLLWTGLHMKPDVLRNLLPYQRVNHFPR